MRLLAGSSESLILEVEYLLMTGVDLLPVERDSREIARS